MSRPRLHLLAAAAAALAVVLALVAGAGLFGPSRGTTHAQQPPGEPTPVFECFKVERGDTPNAVVRLTTKNFGPDVAVVREANRYCEWANKYIDPPAGVDLVPPQEERALQCWNLRKGQDPDDDVVLSTRNFGSHVATIRTAIAMCESALKVITSDDGTVVTYGREEKLIFQCFKVESRVQINRKAALITKNFKRDDVLVRRPELFCEQALKERPNHEPFGEAGPLAFECFSLEAPNHALAAVLVTRNFGKDELRIRRGNLLCEQAKKQHIFEDPTGGGDPTD